MAYKPIPRKYRPQRFSEVVGQEVITETLKNAVKEGRLAHAYIFAGPRGVGKTTTARIVAKAVNCEDLKEGEPCNECSQCLEVVKGSHPDVIEIDAASNRGIDQIRELREAVHYLPAKGKKKVYIIDEFHMLTKEAFNALLKTLEEPPEHVLFILATTEIDKIPPTILSRCQKFVFRRVPIELIMKSLREICLKEGFEFEEEALKLIALSSEGCMRDAESLLEQSAALGMGKVEVEKVSGFLGILTGREVKELLSLGFKGDKEELFKKIKELEEKGFNPSFVVKQLIEVVEREFLIPSTLTEEEAVAAYQILTKAVGEVSQHPYPFTALLFNLYKLSYFKELKLLKDLVVKGSFTFKKEEGEKKTKNDTLDAYIKKVVKEEGRVLIVPDNKLSEQILRSKIGELKKRFNCDVVIKEVEKGVKKREISQKSREVIDKIKSKFNAKILYIKVKDEDFSG